MFTDSGTWEGIVANDGRSATVIAYLLLMSADRTSVSVTTTGFYRIRAVKQETGMWQIDHLFARLDARF